MGLDGVELVMAFEESFGISITDADAAAAVTPGMVVDLICRQLEMTDARTCQTQRAFYLLRRALMTITRKPRQEIAPTTPLRDLFDTHHARDIWPQLKVAVDARGWPQLTRPRWLENVNLGAEFLILLGTPFLMGFAGLNWQWVSRFELSFLLSLLLGCCLAVATRALVCAVPHHIKTVGDLTQSVLSSNQIQWTREMVSKRVKEIVIEQLGTPEAKYSENAHFVRDLGVD